MKKNLQFILLIGAILLPIFTNAQERELIVTGKVNSDKSVTINAEKTSAGTFTVILDVKQLSNAVGVDEKFFKVKHGNNNLVTLVPINKDQNIGYTYSYKYLRGELNPKYSADFVYTLPCKNGRKVRVAESTFFNAVYFGSTTPADWKAYRFYTEQADTVTAIRKGTVVSISDLYGDDPQGVKYTNKVNTVTVEHADGTLANYKGFKKGIFVKEGQVVFPGTELGINTMMNDRYGISLLLSYLKSADIGAAKQPKESRSLYGFVTPYFCTAENSNSILTSQKFYTASVSQALIEKEMTKRELKNFAKKQVQ